MGLERMLIEKVILRQEIYPSNLELSVEAPSSKQKSSHMSYGRQNLQVKV
jgi:hypothetical protein